MTHGAAVAITYVVGVTLAAAIVTAVCVGVFENPIEPQIHEGDAQWIPQLAGSYGTRMIAGQCGQYEGNNTWHEIKCP